MKKNSPLSHFLPSLPWGLGLLFPAILLLASGCGKPTVVPARDASEVPQRVVSLSPALTEMMFELGLEAHLTGVTNHCKYPPEAQQKTHVGTIFSPNLERLATLRPDCILMNCRAPEQAAAFERFGWHPETIPDEQLEDVFAGIRHLGTLFQVQDRAEQVISRLQSRLARLRQQTAAQPPIRVLLVLSRNYAGTQLEEVYVAGRDGLCDRLLRIAGGVNAYEGASPFPKVSSEGILNLNPDVILEVIPDSILAETPPEKLSQAWQALPMLPAVQKKRIFWLAESEAGLIPGPSMVLWAEKTAQILAPIREEEKK